MFSCKSNSYNQLFKAETMEKVKWPQLPGAEFYPKVQPQTNIQRTI